MLLGLKLAVTWCTLNGFVRYELQGMQGDRAMILKRELGKGWRRRMCLVPQKRQWIQQLAALQCKRGEKRGRKQQPSEGRQKGAE